MRAPFPQLVTMGRREVEEYEPGPDEVCISIRSTSPDDRPAALRLGFVDVLPLRFDDDCFEGWRDRDRVISHRDADRVIEFVERHRHARKLVVHCMVGASRSVSLAFALAHCYGVQWAPAWWKKMRPPVGERGRIPNPGVYERVCDAYRRASRRQELARNA